MQALETAFGEGLSLKTLWEEVGNWRCGECTLQRASPPDFVDTVALKPSTGSFKVRERKRLDCLSKFIMPLFPGVKLIWGRPGSCWLW